MARLLVTGCVLAAAAAWAGEAPCQPDGLVLFPAPGAVVPINVQWLLEGVGAEQTRVADLVGVAGVTLVGSDGAAVGVKVERGWVSQVKRVAVRLKPVRPLSPSTRYTLALGPALGGARLLNDAVGGGALAWTTGPGPDKDAPRYRSRPGVAEGLYVPGAQDEAAVRQLRLRLELEERSPAWLLVTLQRMRGSTLRQAYPVPVEGGSAVIGHDACGGSFSWEDGRAYKVQIELVDAAGNRNPERVSLEVSAPRPPRERGR